MLCFFRKKNLGNISYCKQKTRTHTQMFHLFPSRPMSYAQKLNASPNYNKKQAIQPSYADKVSFTENDHKIQSYASLLCCSHKRDNSLPSYADSLCCEPRPAKILKTGHAADVLALDAAHSVAEEVKAKEEEEVQSTCSTEEEDSGFSTGMYIVEDEEGEAAT